MLSFLQKIFRFTLKSNMVGWGRAGDLTVPRKAYTKAEGCSASL